MAPADFRRLGEEVGLEGCREGGLLDELPAYGHLDLLSKGWWPPGDLELQGL